MVKRIPKCSYKGQLKQQSILTSLISVTQPRCMFHSTLPVPYRLRGRWLWLARGKFPKAAYIAHVSSLVTHFINFRTDSVSLRFSFCTLKHFVTSRIEVNFITPKKNQLTLDETFKDKTLNITSLTKDRNISSYGK